ncbi:MAG TPA: alpha-amylase family glycosyl hydrolase [Bacteroidales bacterium]|nr:alpha-amylase family glycosyl hydrolase [Bacteroidales bacterium]
MNSQELTLKLSGFWKTLYPDYPGEILTDFIDELEMVSQKNVLKPNEKQWFKKCVVYCLYVDLFNETFEGLISKLDYLQDLGAGCLWLLPILSSPMKDQGFDISDYKKIRDDLFRKGLNTREQEEVFQKFINAAHGKNIKVIFDIALNHSSDQHEWFRGINTPDSKYKDYYIWAQDTEKYKNVPVLFAPLEKSNWQPKKINGEEWYYFHRFFNHQPDLNYKNPRLLLEMCRSLVFWLQKGIDGFRADAIPFIWKEDDTDCMNLSQAHVVIKFFRTILDYLRPETLLLAEACLPTEKIVEYFGENGSECNAAYHFPLILAIYRSLAAQNSKPVISSLSPKDIANDFDYQWFLFLRGHDELNLEMVGEKDRAFLYENFCHDKFWGFRNGNGVAARLRDLLEDKTGKIALANSILLTLPCTPVIYYGDELGKKNDMDFYEAMKNKTGQEDKRYLVRGKIDWKTAEDNEILNITKQLLNVRNTFECFGKGSLEWKKFLNTDGLPENRVLSYYRIYQKNKILVINNLSESLIKIACDNITAEKDLFDKGLNYEYLNSQRFLVLEPYEFHWIKINGKQR